MTPRDGRTWSSGYKTASEAQRANDRLNGIKTYGYPIDPHDVLREMEGMLRYRYPGYSFGSIGDRDFDSLNQDAVLRVATAWQNRGYNVQQQQAYSMQQSWSTSYVGGWDVGVPDQSHECLGVCKDHELDFYAGLVTYYRLLHPKLVKELEKECSDKKCLSERIKIKLKK